jgi:hypothetical protein
MLLPRGTISSLARQGVIINNYTDRPRYIQAYSLDSDDEAGHDTGIRSAKTSSGMRRVTSLVILFPSLRRARQLQSAPNMVPTTIWVTQGFTVWRTMV